MTTTLISAEEYDEFRRYLETTSGIILGENKHYLVSSRLQRLMREFEIDDYANLIKSLHSEHDTKLHKQLIDIMTSNETLWFRDSYPFEVLKHEVLPRLAAQKAPQLRIWSAACSSGQEAYSISMTIQEQLNLKPNSLPGDIQIIGTDLCTTMVGDASTALYDDISLAHGISEERKQRFFLPQGDKWQLHPEITSRASFQELNLLDDFTALGRFDIIFCRNVLLYFSSELKSDILNRMAASLTPGGYLFLGGSESATSYSDAFEQLRTPRGVVYQLKKKGA